MTTHTPQQASDFEYIYNPDGTCHFWYCSKPGAVLAYDDFSPEVGTWFCEKCWNEFQGDDCNWLTIVEDRRPFVLFFQTMADIAAMKTVESIFHYENAEGEEDESHDEEIEHLEDILEGADYSYVGINNIIYLYKGDDVIADLDIDDYSWKRTDEGVDPIAAANALINAIANVVEDRREKESKP